MEISTEDVLNKWKKFTLINEHGMEVSVLNFGGIITDIITPDQDGAMQNVVLGYKDYTDYEENPNFFGSTVGRVAGRIQDASFTLDDETFTLEANEAPHHLHGGPNGIHHAIWDSETVETNESVGLVLSTQSKDGVGGYPGNVTFKVTYTLNNENELQIDYHAISDKTTALTLTNHTYFNLTGNYKGTVREHFVTMNSDRFVELDEELIPTGKIKDVKDTPFDFQTGQILLDGFESSHEQNKIVDNGYDHYFIFSKGGGQINVIDDLSGRTLLVTTNQPGVVMYTANGLDDSLSLTEGKSKKHLGVCFETQASSASLHHEGFPSVVLKANDPYSKQTIFAFGTKE